MAMLSKPPLHYTYVIIARFMKFANCNFVILVQSYMFNKYLGMNIPNQLFLVY